MAHNLDQYPAAMAEVELEKTEKYQGHDVTEKDAYELEPSQKGGELEPTHDELNGPNKLRRVSDNM